MSTYLITNVSVLGGEPTDLLLKDGVIADGASTGSTDGAEVVDAEGLVALPGLVDLHTHLREPGREDTETIESGSAAAALGGYTAVFAIAMTAVKPPRAAEREPDSMVSASSRPGSRRCV